MSFLIAVSRILAKFTAFFVIGTAVLRKGYYPDHYSWCDYAFNGHDLRQTGLQNFSSATF